MKPLLCTFIRDGFTFRLLKRVGDVTLFEKSKPTHRCASFEIVIVQRHPAETICGRDYPPRESMPPSEGWGTSGWTYNELEGAQRKLRGLVEARQEGHFQPAATPAAALCSRASMKTAET